MCHSSRCTLPTRSRADGPQREPEFNQAILEKWEKVAPGFTKNNNIMKTNGETPEDIEADSRI